jgi:myxalamid-type polyketide synthase MxaF
MALEIRNRLEVSLGLVLSATLVWGYPTLAALAAHLADKMDLPGEDARAPSASATEPAHETAARIAELTEDEAAALLLQELETMDDNQ